MKSSEPASDADGFSSHLRRAIESRGVTLVWLRDRLAASGNPVSLTSLSYWRSGRRRPEGAQSLAAIAEMEALLGLTDGHLADRVGPTMRAGPLTDPGMPEDEDDVRAAAAETFAALAAAPQRSLRDLTTHVVADVGTDGHVVRRTVRSLLQATNGTIREIPYVEIPPEPTDAVPTVVDVVGGRVTRHHHHRSGLVSGLVFELEQPLTAPQAALLEWTSEFPAGFPPLRECAHGVTRQNREALIWVRFHPARLPTWVEEFSDAAADGPLPRRLGEATMVHAVRRRFGPGKFGLRWGYDAAG